MATTNNRIGQVARKVLDPASRGDVLEVGRAVHDKLRADITKRLEDVETKVLLRAGKVLDAETERRTKAMEESFNKRLEHALTKALADAEARHDKALADMQDYYEKRLDWIDQQNKEREGFLRQAHQDAMDRISQLIESLSIPAPVVTVEAPSVSVQVPEPVVNVQAPVVNVAPEVRLPDLNVTFPEQKPRHVRKSIQYDEANRPAIIEEQEV